MNSVPESSSAARSDESERPLTRLLRRLFSGPDSEIRPDGKRDVSYLIWCFLIPFSLMLLIYVLDGVYPFGDRSVLVLDLNAQYVGFYEALRAWIYGDGSLLYSFARSLGGEMMGIYAYYIASPLSYIVALFPDGYMTEALFFLFILKTGLCGLTFGYYLHKNRISGKCATLFFSVMYALSAFAVVMQHNSMWIDNLILLPLITLGLESLIKYRRFLLFTITLALALLSNFYIGFMTCVFVAVYFFFYLFTYTEQGYNNPLGERNHFLRALLRTGLYSVIAVGGAAIILLTAAYSLSFGKTSFSVPDYSFYLRFTPIEFFAKLLPGSYDTVEPQGLPFVYCGSLILLLVPLYFCNTRFSARQRIGTGILLLFFYLCFSINTLDILWHGGQAPNWLNYRYSFIFCFLLLLTAARALTRLQDLAPRTILSVALLLLLCVILAAGSGLYFFPWLSAGIAAAVILLLAFLLYALRKAPDLLTKRALSCLLSAVVLCEAFLSGVYHLYKLHMDVGAVSRDSYTEYHETTGAVIDWVKDFDTDFYRMETTYHRVTNDVMELGYRGLTNSTSTLNYKTIRFLARLGLLSTSHWSEYKGSTLALDSLLGIRYVLTPPSRSPGNTYVSVYTNRNHSVYQNPYALPIAYAVSDTVRSYDFSSASSPLDAMNGIVSAMTGTDTMLYRPLQITNTVVENAERNDLIVNGVEYVELLSDVYLANREDYDVGVYAGQEFYAPDASISFTTTALRSGHVYFYTPTDYRNEAAIYVNGEYIGNIFGYTGDYLKDLGTFHSGDKITVTLKMEKCVFFYYRGDADLFFYEDTSAVTDAMLSLSQQGISLSDFREDYFHGNITTTEERPVVLTTIPYDAGWIVTADGKPVETFETLDALMAFTLSPGEHEITMLYRPQSYVLGLTISLVSLAALFMLAVYQFVLRRGFLRLKPNGVAAHLSSVFMNTDTGIPEEPDYLSDEQMQRAYEDRMKKKKQHGDAETEDAGQNDASAESSASDTDSHKAATDVDTSADPGAEESTTGSAPAPNSTDSHGQAEGETPHV